MIYFSPKNISLAFLALGILILSSCEQSGKVPFPKQKLSAKPPVTEPLVFSAPKKVKWDTISKGNFTPIVQKLDINALPTIPYDSMGFKPIPTPEEVAFDFKNLPSKGFNIEDLPTHKLESKTSIIGPAMITQAGAPDLIQGKALDIYDFGVPQGLRAQFIASLLYDSNGLLWMGGDGLWQYDGMHLKTYVQKFPVNSPVVGLVEDKMGNIWFSKAAIANAINRFNIHDGTITEFQNFKGYANNRIHLTIDNEGKVWFYNALAKGVSIINPGKGTYQNFNMSNGLSDSTAFQVLQDTDQNLWITTSQGVDILDVKNGEIKYLSKKNGLSSDNVQSITQSNDGRVWIASAMGIDAIDVEEGTIKQYRSPALASPFKFQLKFDDIGQLWIASANGMIVLDVTHGTVRSITQKDGLKGSNGFALASDKYHRMWVGSVNGMSMVDQYAKTAHPFGTTPIISTSEDKEGNLWVATQNGLYIVNPERTAMRLLNSSRGLSNNFVQAFFRHNGNMLVTTDGGFNIIDVVNNTILKAGKKEGLSNDTIYSAVSDEAENIWLTGPSNGVDLLKPRQNILLHTDMKGGLSDNAILDIKQNSDGTIWLATQDNGVDILDPETGTIKSIKNKQLASSGRCRVMHEDEYGRMWIGTERGIYIADIRLNTLLRITTKQGLTGNTILSLLSYKGSILVGTNNMISIIKASAPGDSTGIWQISPLAKSEGILKTQTSWATDAITDAGKYYWGDLGMTVIHEIKASQDSVPTYIMGMSVMTEALNFVNHYRISKTDTLLGSDTLYVNGDKPVDTGYIEDNKISYDSVSGEYNLPVNLVLPNDRNYLQFQFTQANLGRPDTVYYTYTLEGIDKVWSAPTRNQFSENYLNLPGGDYTFKVSSRQVNGQWSKPASFSFTIAPPWYQTWWAYTLFILAGLGVLRVYIVYRSRRLKRLNRILEERVSHRTSQLKESIEELKATQSQLVQSEKMASLGELTAGIAHEIQNPLNFVNNFAEINTELIDELEEEVNNGNYEEVKIIARDIKENEQKIVHHGKRADTIVKGMLQHSRNSSGVKEPTDINSLADEYLRLAYHGLRAKDKSFNANMETDFDEKTGKVNVIPQDMGRVILNLITNAFYAVSDKRNTLDGEEKEAYKPTVTVSTKITDHEIEIKVTDNGNGIPQKVIDKIFQPFFTTKPTGQGTGLGLSMSYDIVTKAHNGILKVDTEEGTYTTFTIILPIE